MDISSIQAAVQRYYQNGLATATQRCYLAGQQRYIQFCNQTNQTVIPTSENTLLLFAAHLALSGLAYTSIKVYFSAIGNLHSAHSHHEAYHQALTPRLEQVLRGIKREQCSTRTDRIRLPITAEIMYQIFRVLARPPAEYQNIMLWAACCTAFFGFLRVGEMTIPNQNAYDSSVHLSLQDVSLDSRTTPTIVWLMIKQSKTDLFRKGVKLCLGRTDAVVCPVKALLTYLAIRGNSPGCLFLFKDQTPLTRTRFKTLLSATLRTAGLDDTSYNTHSFRIGAATTAKAVGIADVHIQLLGRWRSSAYQGYIKTPTPLLQRLSQQLVSKSTPEDHPNLPVP